MIHIAHCVWFRCNFQIEWSIRNWLLHITDHTQTKKYGQSKHLRKGQIKYFRKYIWKSLKCCQWETKNETKPQKNWNIKPFLLPKRGVSRKYRSKCEIWANVRILWPFRWHLSFFLAKEKRQYNRSRTIETHFHEQSNKKSERFICATLKMLREMLHYHNENVFEEKKEKHNTNDQNKSRSSKFELVFKQQTN